MLSILLVYMIQIGQLSLRLYNYVLYISVYKTGHLYLLNYWLWDSENLYFIPGFSAVS